MLQTGELDAYLVLGAPQQPGWFSTPVGYSPIGIIVNTDTGIRRLTSRQVKDIYSGRTRRWSELGGADELISLFDWPPDASPRRAFRQLLGLDARGISTARILGTGDQIAAGVRAVEGSIAYIPVTRDGGISGAVTIDGRNPFEQTPGNGPYPLLAEINFVSVQQPEGDTRSFLEWCLGASGQSVVGQFDVPLSR